MYYEVASAMETYLLGLGYLEDTNPTMPIINPTDTNTPKLFENGRVGMPDLIPDWDGPGFIVDIIAPEELGLYSARDISESRFPILISIITQGLTSRTAILCQKLSWLTIKAINHNRTLGLSNVQLTLPDKGSGAVRFGVMPQERLSWNTKNQPKMCFSGQMFWWVDQDDDLAVLESEP